MTDKYKDANKKRLATKFINEAGKPPGEDNKMVRCILNAPAAYYRKLDHIAKIIGTSRNAVVLDILHRGINAKLKELKDDDINDI